MMRKRIIELLEKIKTYKVLYISTDLSFVNKAEYTKLNFFNKATCIWFKIEKSFNSNYYFIDKLDSLINQTINTLKIVFIEDLHYLTNTHFRKELKTYIENSKNNVHFIIFTRNLLTSEYKKLVINNKLFFIEEKELNYTKSEIKDLFISANINLSATNIKEIINISNGYPLFIQYLFKKLEAKKSYNVDLINEINHDIFDFFELEILADMEQIHKRFLLKISLLENIDIESVKYLTGDFNAKSTLDEICYYGNILIKKSDYYEINPFYLNFLRTYSLETFSKNELNDLYHNIASFYKLTKTNFECIKYYILAEEYEQAAKELEIAVKNSIAITDGLGVQEYIEALPEEIILNHPTLCANLAIMYSLKYESEKAINWYNKLSNLKTSFPKGSVNRKVLEESILYCKISLPFTSDIEMIGLLKCLFKLIGNKTNITQLMTMTGNQPTFLSGSKDFCNWCNHYHILKILMKPILEKLFGNVAIGLANLGIAETLYQRNELNEAILEATTGIANAQINGTVDTLFVGYSLLAQIYFSKGKVIEAQKELDDLEYIINNAKAYNLIPNYKARLTRLFIQQRKEYAVKLWLSQTKANIKSNFNTLDRYEYLTQIRALIFLKKYDEALLILNTMSLYIKDYKRTFYEIESYILKSIVFFKMDKKELSFQELEKALNLAHKYKFIRIFTEETYELLTIIKEYRNYSLIKFDTKYLNTIITSMETFFKIHYFDTFNLLTKTERKLMVLIEEGKSNDEIAEILFISKSTVKTHINHIFSKLHVKERTKAIYEYKKLKH